VTHFETIKNNIVYLGIPKDIQRGNGVISVLRLLTLVDKVYENCFIFSLWFSLNKKTAMPVEAKQFVLKIIDFVK